MNRRHLLFASLGLVPALAAPAGAAPLGPMTPPEAPPSPEPIHHRPWHTGGRGRRKRKGWRKKGW